jgi:hypothetical protein
MSSVGKTIGGLFGGGSDAPIIAPPVLAPVTPMPEPDDAAAKRAKRKSQLDQRQRSGRQSTILTDDNETLG